MVSNLRAKLNLMTSSAPKVESVPPRPGGVLTYSDRRAADPRLSALDADGLRRIGWCGLALEPSRLLFLDTETTGLSGGAGTLAFLVGLGWLEGEKFVTEQYLMLDYPDEPELLSRVAQKLEKFDAVCSFNGTNFDIPLLRTRFTLCRMQAQWKELPQLDLLYPARRTWKRRIGSCRLSRVEQYILDQTRDDDIPGSDVPQRYFSFLKSSDMSLLTDVIEHNRQDVATLGVLLAQLCEIYAHPERETHRPDQLSMGIVLQRQGELAPARELYQTASVPAPSGTIAALTENETAAQAAWRLYLLLRRNGDTEGMRDQLERMVNRRQCRDRVYVELSKLYEHRYKDCKRALRYAEMAERYIPESEKEALIHRCERLRAKLEKQSEQIRQGCEPP